MKGMTPDPDARFVYCDTHAARAVCFVCQHLTTGVGLGFFEPEQETVERHAWCWLCERVRELEGGWNDVSETFAGITMMCDLCFEASRERNARR